MSILTNQLIENYTNSLYRQDDPFLTQLRQQAQSSLVPIITRDTERLLYTLCALIRPGRILEIGTAIGYSAVCFAKAAPQARILTIESRERSCHKARENFLKAGVQERVRVLQGKAEEVLPTLSGSFDLIFIDAAKGQYMTFFCLAAPFMEPGCLVISDNVLYKGMPADDSFVDIRRNKTIAKRMRRYLSYLTEEPALETCLLSVGDGVALSFCKSRPQPENQAACQDDD